MTAYVRILLYLAAAVAAIFVALLLVKLIVFLAIAAAIVLGAIYLYHFIRAFARRLGTPRVVPMIGTSEPQN
jgi:hypothetical protein